MLNERTLASPRCHVMPGPPPASGHLPPRTPMVGGRQPSWTAAGCLRGPLRPHRERHLTFRTVRRPCRSVLLQSLPAAPPPFCSLYLHGEWMAQAGFINGMPVKIRVMRDCIVITPQHTCELFGCVEGMSVTYINQKKVKAWLKTFPGALNDTGDIPVIKRKRTEQALMSN